MAAAPPPAPADGALPWMNSSPSPSHPSASLPGSGGGEDGDEGTKKVAGDNGEVAEQLFGGGIHKERSNPGGNDSPRSKNSRKRKHKEYKLQVGEEELAERNPIRKSSSVNPQGPRISRAGRTREAFQLVQYQPVHESRRHQGLILAIPASTVPSESAFSTGG